MKTNTIMKRILSSMAFVSCSLLIQAQTVYDAVNVADKDINGTARFVGMGGAMSALGGDISTMSTNPAGIGIYRNNDIAFTMGYNVNSTSQNFAGTQSSANKYRFTLDNAGVVIAAKIGDRTPLRYANFGFSYRKSKNFYKNTSMAGNGKFVLGGLSQSFLMASLSDGLKGDDWDKGNHYTNNNIGWLSALGYDAYITDFDNSGYYTSKAGTNAYMREFRSVERGSMDEYNFNVAFNTNDRFYFGLTLSAHDVNYRKYSYYDEDWNNSAEGYVLESYNSLDGQGIDAKFGMIVRPFEEAPLKLGFAVHTPTFYNLTYTTGAAITSDVFDLPTDTETTSHTVDTYEELGNRDMERSFHLRTPWLFNVSMGLTVGRQFALDAEYEYKDYKSMKFFDEDGYAAPFGTENSEVKNCLKHVNAFRVGAEFKPMSQFAIRAGYNYQSAIYNSQTAVKYLPLNSINTDTDFLNTHHLNTLTLGTGYRSGNVYVDLAYKYDLQKGDFYPFYNENTADVIEVPEAVRITNNRHKVMMTVGFRF